MNYQDKTSEIASDLIGFPSVSEHSNLDIVGYIEEYLAFHGVVSRRVYDETESKASILATIGPSDRPGVVLSAHTDVVPVEGQDWSSDPFAADLRDGRIYGRGATDMKGFVASVMAAVPRMVAAPLAHPIHIALSYDEEVGCVGAPDLAAALIALSPPPALVIVGEPTGMRLATAHKGKDAYRVTITGRTGHSAMTHATANAVEAAAETVFEIVALGRRYRDQGVTLDAFTPPWTTAHVGSFHGGGALNLVPDRCEFAFEIRNLPGQDVSADIAALRAGLETRIEDMRTRAPESAAHWHELMSYPPLTPPDDPAIVAFVAELAEDGDTPGALSFGTDGGVFARAGLPAVVCGPGDIARAHKADEFITLDELAACDRFLDRLIAASSQPLPLPGV